MGITGFPEFVKDTARAMPETKKDQIFRTLTLSDIASSVVILDCNAVIIRYGSASSVELEMLKNANVVRGFMKLFDELSGRGNRIIVVTDMKQDLNTTGIEKYIKLSITSFKKQYKHLDTSVSKVTSAINIDASSYDEVATTAVLQAKQETQAKRREVAKQIEEKGEKHPYFASTMIIQTIEALCIERNIEFYKCALEADGLMASIACDISHARRAAEAALADTKTSLNNTQDETEMAELAEMIQTLEQDVQSIPQQQVYIMSEDSDMWIYDLGGAHILRKCSINGRIKGNIYEDVDIDRFWKILGNPSDEVKFRIPLLMKCDYFTAMKLIGPKRLLRIITYNWEDYKTKFGPTFTRVLKLYDLIEDVWPLGESSDKNIEKVLSFATLATLDTKIEKLGFTIESVRYLTLDQLKSFTIIKRPIYRNGKDIDRLAFDKLNSHDKEIYIIALFRFQEGSNFERACMQRSRIPVKPFHEIVKETTGLIPDELFTNPDEDEKRMLELEKKMSSLMDD